MIELRWLRIPEYREGAIQHGPLEWRVLQVKGRDTQRFADYLVDGRALCRTRHHSVFRLRGYPGRQHQRYAVCCRQWWPAARRGEQGQYQPLSRDLTVDRVA